MVHAAHIAIAQQVHDRSNGERDRLTAPCKSNRSATNPARIHHEIDAGAVSIGRQNMNRAANPTCSRSPRGSCFRASDTNWDGQVTGFWTSPNGPMGATIPPTQAKVARLIIKASVWQTMSTSRSDKVVKKGRAIVRCETDSATGKRPQSPSRSTIGERWGTG